MKSVIGHVWSGASSDSKTIARMKAAAATWQREAAIGNWIDIDLSAVSLGRDGTSVGDPVALPFIHDMIERGFDNPNIEIVLITNADICLCYGFADEVRTLCEKHGSLYCHRWDFTSIQPGIYNKEKVATGKWYAGADAFAVTRRWWTRHKQDLPPFILGRETWDWIFRELIKETGGVQMHSAIYHEKHDSAWKNGRLRHPGNVYNRSYARAWLRLRNMSLKEIANAPFNEIAWPPTKYVQKKKEPEPANITDVLIVLGRGSKWSNTELRYCLRSLEKYAKNMGKIWVVGNDPGFLSPEVGFAQHDDFGKNKEHNIAEQIYHACKTLPMTDNFFWINDDTFLLKDTDISTYPYYSGGSLRRKWSATAKNGYRVALMQTEAQLIAKNLPTITFEIHCPIRYSKEKFISLKHWIDLSARVPMGLTFRSVYCNVLGIAPTNLPDMKLGNVANKEELIQKVADRDVFSIGDGLSDDAKAYFHDIFPTPSKYEA